MSEQLPFLVAPYEAFAPVYERAGFADYSRRVVLRYIDQAQTLDWAGRRILEIGCGTGAASWILSERGFRVTGIDASPHMIAQAEANAPATDEDDDVVMIAQEPPQFEQQDMRQLISPVGGVDMVIAVEGVINALTSLRELQQTFAQVAAALEDGRFFVFDAWTIRGLASVLGTRDHVYHSDSDLLVMARHTFNFELLTNQAHYMIFQRQDDLWTRADELHALRAYPVQGIAALLERTGFKTLALLDPEMRPFDEAIDDYGRVVFIAQRTVS